MPARLPCGGALRLLLLATALLALGVVTLGAYVRLKDAGLGCPDWPGCYGQLAGVPAADATGQPVDQEKAWIEVIHRYAAGILGLMIAAATVMAWRERRSAALQALTAGMLALVVFQAALGALTVTRLLQPLIVTGHLLGGLALLSMLLATCVLVQATPGLALRANAPGLRPLLIGCLVAITAQVALGGWVSSNYAGLACGPTVATCQGRLVPDLDASGFALDRQLHKDAQGKQITNRALATIQWLHRIGAAVVFVLVAALAVALVGARGTMAAAVLFGLLLAQMILGIHIVASGLPLPPSLLHNTVAALLCAALTALAVAVWTRRDSPA